MSVMAKRGRPAKLLKEHLRDGTFRIERHAALVEEALPGTLGRLAERYQATEDEQERRAISKELRDAIEALPDQLTFEQFRLATMGPLEHQCRQGEWEALYESWRDWDRDRRFGFLWRVRHGCMHNLDRQFLYELVYDDFDEYPGQDVLRRLEPELLEALHARDDLPAHVPDPPGWELVN